MSDLSFLVVDDDLSDSHALAQILIDKYKTDDIDIFKNPANALEIIKRRNYSLIISNARLEPVNGFELYKKIKEITDTPVILMSVSAKDKEFKKIAKELGIEIIEKPFDYCALLLVLNRYVPFPESS